jgi:AcrR family transcriptional regulator
MAPQTGKSERSRLCEAMIGLCVERRYSNVTVELVLERAELGPEAFECHFADLEDCFCQIFEAQRDEFARRVEEAYAAERGWANQLRAGAYAMLFYFDEDRRRALFMREAFYAGERANLLRDQANAGFVALIDQGREQMADPGSLSVHTAETIAGAIYQRMQSAADRQAFELFGKGVGEMMYTAVLPYLGPEAATAELRIAPPPCRSGSPRRSSGAAAGYSLPVAVRRKETAVGAGPELGPLPGGHHGLSPEQVAESQRERLLGAVAEAVAAKGYAATTISDIVTAASVSSRAFYENFDSKEQCFLAAFDAVIAHLRELIDAAVAGAEDWPHKAIAALRAALHFFAAEPDLARICIVEPLAASPAIAAHFRALVDSAVPELRTGRAQFADAEELPESTEDSLFGGLIVLTSRSIVTGDPGALESHLPDLAEFVLSPYVGPKAAKQLAGEAAL